MVSIPGMRLAKKSNNIGNDSKRLKQIRKARQNVSKGRRKVRKMISNYSHFET